MERLSTGIRINSAKDDAAGLAISTRMTAKLRGISAAVRNAHDGLSILEVAEGGINSISNAIQRIRELAIQSASATNNFDDRANLNLEANQLLSEIDRVASDTSFNGIKLLDGSFQNIPLQIGPDNNTNDSFQISIDSVKTSSLGVGSSTRTVSTSISISPPTTPSNTGASGTVSVSVSPVSVSESGSTNLTYTFTRTGDTSQELKVNVDLAGTANAADYVSNLTYTPASSPTKESVQIFGSNTARESYINAIGIRPTETKIGSDGGTFFGKTVRCIDGSSYKLDTRPGGANARDISVTKFNADGTESWTRWFGTSDPDYSLWGGLFSLGRCLMPQLQEQMVHFILLALLRVQLMGNHS